MADRSDEDLLDAAELAKHLGVKRRSLLRLVADGRLPAPVRYGGLPRWRWGTIRDWQRAWEVIDRMPKGAISVTGATKDVTLGPEGENPPSDPKKRR